MKYKLLIYMWREGLEQLSHCIIFEFATLSAANEAQKFFARGDTYTLLIEDSLKNLSEGRQ